MISVLINEVRKNFVAVGDDVGTIVSKIFDKFCEKLGVATKIALPIVLR